MENNPLLSIVIPSRNREAYCIEAIKDILHYQENCFELVIQDNSDSDRIEEYVVAHQDKRLKYFRIKGRINSVINMCTAVGHAVGEYICMIGDDDTVLPNIFSLARWAKDNGIAAIAPKLSYGYLWDENGLMTGKLVCHGAHGKVEFLNPQKQLSLLLKNGIIQYDKYDLPRLYHGLMRRDIVEKIEKKTGHYIGGLSPDIYLSCSSCFWIDKYVKVSFPFTIPGACVQSTSVGNPRGKFEDMPHLWNRGEYKWNEFIPKYNSAQTIWAETALKAIEENANDDYYLRLFNKKYFYTAFWLQNGDRHEEIRKCVGAFRYIYPFCYIKYKYRSIKKKSLAIYNFIIGERKVFCNIDSWKGVLDVIGNKLFYLN